MQYSSLALSIAAIVVSAFFAIKQSRLAKGGNHLPVITGEFKTSRLEGWLPAQEYILNDLAREHPPECGWRGLPPAARAHVDMIGIFYDDLGKQVAHGMIDQDLVIGSYGMPIVYLWDVLAPYVYEERRAHMPNFWVYFEELAVRTAERRPEMVYRKLGLRRRPPRREPATAGSVQPLARIPAVDLAASESLELPRPNQPDKRTALTPLPPGPVSSPPEKP